MRKFPLVCVAVLALSGMASAQSNPCGLLPSALASQITSQASWYCPINQQIYNQWSKSLPLAAIAVLIAFSAAAIITMFGIALRSDKLRNFGIAEIYEATASAIIVGIFLYLCAVMFGLTPAVFVGGINPYATALNLISGTITQAQGLFSSTFNVYYTDRFIVSLSLSMATVTLNLAMPINLALASLDTGLTFLVIDPARAIALFLADGIFALHAEYYILVFFSVAAIPVFLIPGVVFRAFFPTRTLGGVLMAIGIAFYLVMPALFAVAFYLTSPSVQQSMANAQAQMTRFGSGAGAATNAATPQSPIATQLQSIQSSMGDFWLLVLFYPGLIMGVTYVFIAQLTEFIGGAYRNVGKLRLFI